MKHKLSKIEGRSVEAVGVTIPGAGGGLREALNVEPVELAFGEKVYVVLECVVDELAFPPLSKDTPKVRRRVHKLDVVSAAFADEDLVRPVLEETQAKIVAARVEAEEAEAAAKAEAEREERRARGEHEFEFDDDGKVRELRPPSE